MRKTFVPTRCNWLAITAVLGLVFVVRRVWAGPLEDATELLRRGEAEAADRLLVPLVQDESAPAASRAAAIRLRIRCRRQLADFQEVVDLCEALESLYVAADDPRNAALTRVDRGAALVELGHPRDAIQLISDAIRALETVAPKAERIRPLLALSQAEGALGNYARALGAAETASREAEAVQGDKALRARAQQVFAASLLRMGDFGGAEAVLRRLLAEEGTLGPSTRAQVQGDLAQVLGETEDFDGALERLADASHWFASSADIRGQFVTETTWSALLRRLGKSDDALTHARTAETLATGRPLLDRYARFEVGATLAALSRNDEAQTILEEVLANALLATDGDLITAASIELVELFARTGRADSALKHAYRALSSMNRSITGLTDGRSAEALTRRSRLFASTIQASRVSGKPSAMIDYVERCRAVALLSSIGGKRAADATDRTEALQALAATAKQAADDLARDVAQHSEVGDLRGDALSALKRRASDAVSAADAARERVQREKGLHAATVPTAFASPADVAGMLRPGQVFVSICTLDDKAFALVVAHGRSDVRYVELGESRKFVAQCEDVREAALNEEPRAVAVAKTAGDALLARLALPPSTTSIVLSVDAELADVPFGALVAAGPTPIAVAMAPSATVWQALRAYPVVKDRPALVAGISDYGFEYADTTRRVYLGGGRLASLPTAVTEANAAAGATGVLLANERATEPAVRTAMQDEAGWDAVHVVCHGVIHPRVPALSGLALRPAGTDDGFFDVREVLDLRVRTNLVVLAACQTGLGKVYAGEGIWGLGRAFMLAGAPRVLVSLWKVDDAATTELMSAFHDGRRAGLGAAAALRRAQEHVRETPGWAHPKYWAAWQLWGLPD